VSYTVLPVLQIVAGEAQPLNTPVEFSVVIADLPGTTVEWDWGDGSPVEAGATSPGTEPGTLDVLNTHAFASPGPFTITLTVDYGAVTQTATVEYSAGLAPDIVSVTGPVAPIPESTTASVTVVFEDDSEAHTVTFDWGDGSSMTTVNLGPGEFEASASHPYFDPDAYTVTVTVTDATGLSDTETVFVVVYDPNGRRMWGLGDVDLDADHNLGFGFFVRNTKWFGPKGAFAFDVDNCSVAEVLQWQCIGFPNELVFVSTDVDEFYVLGDWAVATGTGYIVGDSGTYDWALVVGDESPDEIRVRIRDASDPSIVVFDTNPGDWVFTEPTIDIDSGIIKIVTR